MKRKSVEQLISEGVTPLLAEMLSAGRPPGCVTDREFMRDVPVTPSSLRYRQVTKKLTGQMPTDNARYLPQLARFAGDPQAWVTGRGDVQRLCEQRGDGCEGLVKVKKRLYDNDVADDKPIEPNPIHVQDAMWREEQKDPDLKFASKKKRKQKYEDLKAKAAGPQ